MSNARILVVDDEADIRDLVQEILTEEGYVVTVAGNAAEAREACAGQQPDLVLLDIWMPDTDGISLLREWQQAFGSALPVVMMSGHGTVETAVEATRLGAIDYVEKPLSLAKLLRTVRNALEEGGRRKRAARAQVPPLIAPAGRSRVMRELRDQVKHLAPHEAPVLIVGETGTGREAFARYLHSLSPRSGGPFVTIIAAALGGDGAEAALHGSESGGTVRKGFLEQAERGVLFLNEIGDLAPAVQRLLVAAIEGGTFQRVGGSAPVRFDARIVSSAQPGFEAHGAEPVRLDLLSQLNTLMLRVPPLREYAEDVPELLRHYVDRLVEDERLGFRRFTVAAQNRLRNYPWPGNIRELKNVIERAYLTQQLQLCGGKVGQLAKRVGMERTHLYRKLRSLGVDFRQTDD